MMKVLQINSVYKKGSTGSIVASIHSYLKEHEIDSYVCYGRGSKLKEEHVYKISTELEAKINHIRSKLTGMVYAGCFISTSRLISKIKQIKPDVVHIHNLNDYYVNEYRLLTYLAKHKYKTIITMHSEQYYTGTCGHSVDCTKWKEHGCDKCPHIRLSTGTSIDRTKKAFKKLKKCYDFFPKDQLSFVACTPWLEENAKESLLLSKFNTTTILNGGDEKIFHPIDSDFSELRNELHISKDNKVVVFVCPRLNDPIKGYQFIPKIREGLDNSYSIVVVGKITDDIEQCEDVIYTDEVKNKNELALYYNLADVTIMLSQRECLPMTIIESILCGTPVVAFKCFGPDKAFPQNEAVFIEQNNIKQFVNKIKSAQKINKIISNITSDKMCDNYNNLY